MKQFPGWSSIVTLTVLVGACGEGTTEPSPPAVASVTVSRDTATLVPAATLQLSAVVRTAAGTQVQRPISWTSSDQGIATVSNSGLVAGVAPGLATITVVAGAKTATTKITVLDGGIVSSSGGTLTLQSGAVQIGVPADALASATNLTVAAATGVEGDPRVVTGSAFEFGPPGANFAKPVVLQLRYNPANLPAGTEETALELFMRTSSGWEVVPQSVVGVNAKTVTVSVSHFSTYAILTPEAVAGITMVGALPLTVGESEQLTATVTGADGRVLTNRIVTWSSSDATILSISESGTLAALKAGSAIISASAGGKTTSVPVTVNAVPVATVRLSAAITPMVIGETQQLTAVTRDARGNELTGRQVNWASSDAAVMTVSASGLMTAIAQGTATITATSESVSATTPAITVNAPPPAPVNTVTVSPASASIPVGGTQQLAAVIRDAAGNMLTDRPISWTSGAPSVATVDGSGLVTALSAGGPITITATSQGKNGTSSITVPLTIRAIPIVTSGLAVPVFLTQPLNDGRMFVVEKAGRIRVVRDGVLQTTPFLSIVGTLLPGGEQGLLSVAFHPQYATNRYFYIYFTGLSGEIRIERFTTTSDPSVADPASRKLVFTTPHASAANHNGGLVAFGPDGMLYAALGDGGGAGDPAGNAQNFNEFLGGMIRIDVDHGDPYSVPADNPFVGQVNKKPELWAKGLRNPWRFAFDPPTGMLFIADVGQDLHEEVDAVSAAQGGLNYGWNKMEGFSCYNATTCNQTGLQLPVLDYGRAGGACSITGGYVYRGSAMHPVEGHYFYADYCAGWLRSFRYQNGIAVEQKDWGVLFPPFSTLSFGKDLAGELYVMSGNSVFKLVPGS